MDPTCSNSDYDREERDARIVAMLKEMKQHKNIVDVSSDQETGPPDCQVRLVRLLPPRPSLVLRRWCISPSCERVMTPLGPA